MYLFLRFELAVWLHKEILLCYDNNYLFLTSTSHSMVIVTQPFLHPRILKFIVEFDLNTFVYKYNPFHY